MREVFFLLSLQIGVFAVAVGLNIFNKSYCAFFKNLSVLVISALIMCVSGYVIKNYEEYRKTEPKNYILLACATLGIAMFVASLAAFIDVGFVFSIILADLFAVLSLYIAARYIQSTKVRDDLYRNLFKGLIGGFLVNLLVLFLILTLFGSKRKLILILLACLVCAICGVYYIYAMVFIIIPSLDDDGDSEDIILGLARLYFEYFRINWLLGKILINKCRGNNTN